MKVDGKQKIKSLDIGIKGNINSISPIDRKNSTNKDINYKTLNNIKLCKQQDKEQLKER